VPGSVRCFEFANAFFEFEDDGDLGCAMAGPPPHAALVASAQHPGDSRRAHGDAHNEQRRKQRDHTI
jgi:hypothetical protein